MSFKITMGKSMEKREHLLQTLIRSSQYSPFFMYSWLWKHFANISLALFLKCVFCQNMYLAICLARNIRCSTVYVWSEDINKYLSAIFSSFVTGHHQPWLSFSRWNGFKRLSILKEKHFSWFHSIVGAPYQAFTRETSNECEAIEISKAINWKHTNQ